MSERKTDLWRHFTNSNGSQSQKMIRQEHKNLPLLANKTPYKTEQHSNSRNTRISAVL